MIRHRMGVIRWRLAAMALAALLAVPVLLQAGPPMPDTRPDNEESGIYDENAAKLGQDYVDLIQELETVLEDFNDYYDEKDQAPPAAIAKSVKLLEQSLNDEYSPTAHEKMLKRIDDVIARIETALEEADDDPALLKRRDIRQLKSFTDDLESIREELDAEFSDSRLEKILDGEQFGRIIERAMKEYEKAMAEAMTALEQLDSEQLIIVPPQPSARPEPPKPPKMIVHPHDKSAPDYYILKSQANDYDGESILEDSFSVTSHTEVIELHNDIGGITVNTRNQSRVTATLVVNYSEDSRSSSNMAREVRLVKRQTPQGLVLEVEFPDDGDKTINVVATRLEVSLPAANPVIIENSFGPVEITDLQNALTITSNFGSVNAGRITGDVMITGSSGQVAVNDITGRLEINNSFAAVEVTSAKGSITLSNSYAAIEVRNSTGEMTIANSGAVTVSSHQGNVTIESSNGEVEVYRLTGRLEATNSFGAMRVETVSEDVTVENANAEIELSDIDGTIRASNRFGAIRIDNAGDTVRAESSNAEITIEKVSGPVIAVNRYGGVTVEDAAGTVQVDNRNAEVRILGAGGNVRVSNQFAVVSVSTVAGDVEVDNQNAAVDMVDITGAVIARTTFGAITAENLKGPFDLDNSNGSVELVRVIGLAKDSRVRTTGGDITVELPESMKFNIEATTTWGSIDSELPMKMTTSRNTTSATYTTGAGVPMLTLEGENSSITISTRP